MERWTCPNCNRIFGKTNQSHLACEPAVTIDEYFAQARTFERPIFDAVISGLGDLEGLIIDPLNIGILLKNGPMFAELRPKTKWTALGFSLGRRLESGKLSRKVVDYGKKHFHVINMTEPDQVDDQVLEWLVEAYHLAGRTNGRRSVDVSMPPQTLRVWARNSVSEGAARRGNGGDGMVPDDIEDIF